MTTLSSTGGTSIVANGIGPALTINGFNSGSGISIVDDGLYLTISSTEATFPVGFFNCSPLNGIIGAAGEWEIVPMDSLYPDWVLTGNIPDFSPTNIGGTLVPPVVSGGTTVYTGFVCNRTGVYQVSHNTTVYNSGLSDQFVGTCIFYTEDNGGTWKQQASSMVVDRILPGSCLQLSRVYPMYHAKQSKYILCVFASSTDIRVGSQPIVSGTFPLGPGGTCVTETVSSISWHLIQSNAPEPDSMCSC